jgi:hypothetical protein
VPDAPPTSPPRRIIATDLPCIHCAYNLRTADLASRCPECGQPTADSLDSLALADAGDLARLLSGLRLMLIAAVVGPCVVLGMIGLSELTGSREDWQAIVFGIAVCIAGPVTAYFGARKSCARIRGFAPPQAASSRDQWQGSRAPAILGSLYFCFAAAGLLSILANELDWFYLSELIPVGLFGIAALLWLSRNVLVYRRGAWLAGHASSPRFARTLTWMARTVFVCASVFLVVGGACYLIDFAQNVLHVDFFDPAVNGRTLPTRLLSTIAIATLYVTFFGPLLMNPVALALLHKTVAASLRIAHARAGGPVLLARDS